MDAEVVQALREEIAALRREVAALRLEIAPYTRMRVGARFALGFLMVTGVIALALDRIWDLAMKVWIAR